MADKATKDRVGWLERRVGELQSELARRPIREGKAPLGDRGRVIYAQVNEVSGVGAGDPTFSFDNAVAIVGGIPTGGTGTAQNQYGQTYANNEWVLLFQEKDTDQWLTERGGESGSQIIYAELTQNKGYADDEKLAKPVLADGTLDTGAPDFYLIDDQELPNRFYGLAEYTDGDTGAAVHRGYRYHARRISDNWNASGKAGYLIIDGEGPADFLIVALDATVSSGSAHCNLVAGIDPVGGPDSAREPRIEDNGWDVTVYDDFDIAGGAAIADLWVAKWDRSASHYVFWRRVELDEYFIRVRGTTTTSVAASTTSFSITSVELLQGKMPTLSSGNLTVQNVAKIVLGNGELVEVRWNEDDSQWETEPKTTHMVLGLATAAVTGGSFTIDNIELVSGSDPRSNPASSAETLSVSNPFAWDIDDNGQVLATKKASGTWIAIQAACPA